MKRSIARIKRHYRRMGYKSDMRYNYETHRWEW